MPNFSELGIGINFVLFGIAAILVWFAGSRLTRYAEAISKATGIGHAVVGIVLLAGITSLPEIAVTATASFSGDAELAVNNLFGSIALQVTLLAGVDFVVGRRALTSVVPEPAVMLEGSLNVILISTAAAAMIVGDVPLFGAGAWSWGLLVAYIGSVWMLARAEGRRPWLAARDDRIDRNLMARESDASQTGRKELLTPLVLKTIGVAAIILAAGLVLARAGGAIAEQTGLGSSFVGFVLVAIATSLPELSTALAAASRGLVTLAISDILGTNLINVGLVFLADLIDTGEPVLGRLSQFAIFGALLAIVLTAIMLAGLAERRDRSLFRMGYDSILVLLVYVGGVALLYGMRTTQ
jgi:cation:H+ antiporter